MGEPEHGLAELAPFLSFGASPRAPIHLIEAARAPDFPAEIVLVASNRPDAPGLARAKAAGLGRRRGELTRTADQQNLARDRIEAVRRGQEAGRET